jgi:hypothetical protein
MRRRRVFSPSIDRLDDRIAPGAIIQAPPFTPQSTHAADEAIVNADAQYVGELAREMAPLGKLLDAEMKMLQDFSLANAAENYRIYYMEEMYKGQQPVPSWLFNPHPWTSIYPDGWPTQNDPPSPP